MVTMKNMRSESNVHIKIELWLYYGIWYEFVEIMTDWLTRHSLVYYFSFDPKGLVLLLVTVYYWSYWTRYSCLRWLKPHGGTTTCVWGNRRGDYCHGVLLTNATTYQLQNHVVDASCARDCKHSKSVHLSMSGLGCENQFFLKQHTILLGFIFVVRA